MRTFVALSVTLLMMVTGAHAQSKEVSVRIPTDYKVLNYSSADRAVTRSATGGAVTLEVSSGSKGRLYLVDGVTSELAGSVVLAVKVRARIYTWQQARALRLCRRRNARAVYGYTVPGNRLVLGQLAVKDGFAIARKSLRRGQLDLTSVGTMGSNCTPTGTASTLGLGTAEAQTVQLRSGLNIFLAEEDSDSDGLINILDADDDNDDILDSYDADTSLPAPVPGTVAKELKIFTNNKPSIQNSLNAYTQTVTAADIDSFVGGTTLAIQVAGGSTLDTELDCGTLGYCSLGGTGTILGGGAFPGSVDTDSDGLGTIVPGGTGDFQLATNATDAAALGAGDVLVEVVNNGDGTSTSVATMLTFVFNTSPAVASLTLGSSAITPVYPPTSTMLGSENNPWEAPPAWDQKLTVTAYRPQRPGITGAGEADLVDIGNSNIDIDIPNLPCSAGLSGACPAQNTSRSTAGSYTESDSNLIADGDGLKDARADQDTNTATPLANQVTFTVDLSTCLSETWDSGEKLAIDLQFSNDIGDNAAQKFYIKLP